MSGASCDSDLPQNPQHADDDAKISKTNLAFICTLVVGLSVIHDGCEPLST